VKIATWNVNGIRARQDQVAAFVERERPDVLCLQEIKAAVDHIPKTVCELPGYWCYWHGTKGYSGVGLHVRKELSPDRPLYIHPEFDHETRIAATRVDGILVASIYVPNGGKDFAAKVRFLTAMEAYAASLRATGDRVLLCGDLNIARTERDVHPRERDARVIGQRSDERVLFERILDGGGLHDVGREQEPDNDALFTWWAPWRNMRERNIGWRLDYLLASGELADRAAGCVSMREFGTSDHAPVVATFRDRGGANVRGPGAGVDTTAVDSGGGERSLP
jgi:exodeoxyribonuclease-3